MIICLDIDKDKGTFKHFNKDMFRYGYWLVYMYTYMKSTTAYYIFFYYIYDCILNSLITKTYSLL